MLRAEIIKRCVFQPAACLFTEQHNPAEHHIHQGGCQILQSRPFFQAGLAPGHLLARVKEPMKSAVTLASEEQS